MKVKPPRTVFLRWPFGHPVGEPFNIAQQRTVAAEALRALYTIEIPGTILDLPYPWRRAKYDGIDIAGMLRPLGRAEQK